jgi:hypothetical protein
MIRLLSVLVVLAVAGCDQTPESLGITGPAPPAPQRTIDDTTIVNPGITDPGSGYGNSIGPGSQKGRYYNYN